MIDQLLYERCSCVDALAFFFDLNDLEVKSYFLLLRHEDMTIAELCQEVSRNQSTVYTAVEKLVASQVVTKSKRGRSGGGYEYVYSALAPAEVKVILTQRLDKLYSKLSSCLNSFDVEALSTNIDLDAL